MTVTAVKIPSMNSCRIGKTRYGNTGTSAEVKKQSQWFESMGTGIINIKASRHWKDAVERVQSPPLLLPSDRFFRSGKLPSFSQLMSVVYGGQNAKKILPKNNGKEPVDVGDSRCDKEVEAHSSSTLSFSREASKRSLQTSPTESICVDNHDSVDTQRTTGGTSSVTCAAGSQSSVGAAQLEKGRFDTFSRQVRKPDFRSRRRFHGATPSNFCHVCQKMQKGSAHVVCSNIELGICRKVVCKRCCAEYGLDYGNRAAADFVCPHCRSSCPPRSQCYVYEKTNERRRNGTLKKRKSRYFEAVKLLRLGRA